MSNVSSKNDIRIQKERSVSTRAVVFFFIALALCSLMVGFTIRNKSNLERLTMERLILEHSVKITEVISKLLHKTQALSALVIQGNGAIENFERVAATIVDDPAILNILIAPDGVVSHVYPEAGSGGLVGFSILGGIDAGNTEAVMAYESDALVFGGPFELMQGGRAMVGRLSVWIDESSNIKRFWGLVSVTLKYPEALDGAALDSIEKQGFAYEIWRTNPDDGMRQVIMTGKNDVDSERFRFIEKHIPILNADWYFRIAPVLEWYQYSENWVLIIAGFCISFLIAFVVQNNFELKKIKVNLEHHEYELRNAVTIAEDASRMKTSFLATVSHEIRTPMNGIIGFLDLAQEERGVPDRIKNYLDHIKSSSEGMLEIINDILDISKIEAGRVELENIPFDLSEVVSICEAMTMPKAMERGVRLSFRSLPPDALHGKRLLGDPLKLRQIFMNLLSNAIKFTEEGSVAFAVDVLEIADGCATFLFVVRDTGIGMTEEQLGRIFKSFMQADSGTTRKYGGTGLGLPISRNLIELMGGELIVQSTLGEGSVFSFTLTLGMTEAPAEEPSGQAGLAAASKTMRPLFTGEALVCEDNRTNQQVLIEQLARAGMKTYLAVDGREGLEMALRRKAEGRPFDIILMDIHMPVMDGVKATRRMRAAGIVEPIVAVTANIMSHDLASYTSAGMVDYLGKPFRSRDLREVLRRYIEPVGYEAMQPASSEDAPAGRFDISMKAPSIDRALGLERSVGDEALYNKLLADFAEQNRDVSARIREAIRANRYPEAHRTAHSLASSSETLGAVRLGETARSLENALSGGASTVDLALVDDLELELNSTLTEIELYVPDLRATKEPGPSSYGDFDPDRAMDLLLRLAPLLGRGDSSSLDLLDEAREVLSPLGGEVLVLLKQIEDYDFDLACETLNALKHFIESDGRTGRA